MDYFVKIKKESLVECNEIFLCTYSYFYRFKSIENMISLTIKDMVKYFNYKPDSNKGRINDQFKKCIYNLVNEGYIEYKGCYTSEISQLDKCKDNQLLWFEVKNVDDSEFWDVKGNFVKLEYQEIDKILNIRSDHTAKLIKSFLSIKQFISATESVSSVYIAYPSKSYLEKTTGFSRRSLDEYINSLTMAKILYCKKYGSYKRIKNGEELIQNANTVYALDPSYLDGTEDVRLLIQYLKSTYNMIGDTLLPYHQPINSHQKYVNRSKRENYSIEDIDDDIFSDDFLDKLA